MCGGTSSDMSSAEKLELLTAHADAWQSLDTACPEKADILVGWSAPIAVSCNVMVFSRRSLRPRNHWGIWNDGNAELMMALTGLGPLDLLVLRVPSALRRVQAAHWVLDLPVCAGEVCIDASQDLLIYLSYAFFFSTLHPFFAENETDHVRVGVYPFGGILFRNRNFYPCILSSGASHPLAERGTYFGACDTSSYFWDCDTSSLCVCGDFVAGIRNIYFISVWNWKTGQHVSDQVRIFN
jgi:hypothetical protein